MPTTPPMALPSRPSAAARAARVVALRGAARLGGRLERGALVLGVLRDGGVELGDEVGPAAQLAVHVAPGGLRAIARPRQPVVDQQRARDDDEDERQDGPDHHAARLPAQ